MNKSKFDNSEVGEGRLSRRPRSFTSRFLGMTGAAALVLGGAGSVFIGASAASATIGTQTVSYSIGAATAVPTIALSNAVASSSATVNNLVTYTINFVSPVAIAAGGTVAVGITVGNTSGTIASGATMADSTGGWGPLNVTPTTAADNTANATAGAQSTLTLAVPSTQAVKAGDSISIVLTGVANPTVAGTSYTVTVTPQNAVGATSAAFAITPASTTVTAATPTVTSSNLIPSAVNANYTFSGFTTNAVVTTSTNTLNLTSAETTTSTGNYTAPVFPTNASQYTLKDSAGNSYPVTGVSSISGGVAISSSTTIPSGTVLTLTVSGVQNPGATSPSSANTTFTINSSIGTSAPTTTAAALDYGTAVTGASFSASNLTVGGTSNDTVGFTATSAIVAGTGNTITVGETGATANITLPTTATDYIIMDNTTGNSTNPTIAPSGNQEVLTLPSSFGVNAGDKVSVEILGVTNGATAGAVTDFAVATFSDPLVVTVPQFTLLATAPTTSQLSATVTPNTAGATASYTLQGITVKTAYAASNVMDIYFGSGTFPSFAGAYTITDLTNSASSETPTKVVVSANNQVAITLSNSLAA